ncbi:hypothetical protein I553_3418 [Mycobacterium xenopi 4042]|uniref:NLP/P60 family protein n=1 Tax=Mycobacterium xenopi 4042 TaxID=1299334 RepID=X7ZZ65_MYCXE|nr:hypothetical protein I553_3418 [Mycobacterium xenopi 4042]
MIAGFVALSGALSANVLADPSDDALAKLNELSRQAEQTTEAMHSAQLDLNEKLAAQRAAEKKHADAQADLEAAKARLATFQASVNKFAAAMYMGGRTDGMEAILTAESPQQLISKLAVQRVISTEMATQMASYRAPERLPLRPNRHRPNRRPTPRPPPSRPPRCGPACNPSRVGCSCRSPSSSRSISR